MVWRPLSSIWLAAGLVCSAVPACESGSSEGARLASDGGMADVSATTGTDGGTEAAPESSADSGFDGGPEAMSDTSEVGTEYGPGCKDGGTTQCGAPTLCGPVVQTLEIVGMPPAALGGSLVPGSYVLTSANVYRQDAGGTTPTFQFTYSFAGAQFAEASYENGFQQSPISGSYQTTDTTLTRTLTCPTSVTTMDQYTATTSSLTIYQSPNGSDETYELISTRQ